MPRVQIFSANGWILSVKTTRFTDIGSLRLRLVVASRHIAQETAPHEGGDDAEFVLGSDVGVEQTLVAQALDAVPATVLELPMVAAFVLMAEQQDVEIGAQQTAAHRIQVLWVVVLHLALQVLTHVEHGRTPWRKDPHAVALVLAITVQHVVDGD